MKTQKLLTVFCVLFAAAAMSMGTAAQAQERQIIESGRGDYFGFDLSTEKNLSLDQCKARCLGNPACRAFTYNTSARFCFLKTDFGAAVPEPDIY